MADEKVTEAGVSKLKKALPNLEIVTGWEQKEGPKRKGRKGKEVTVRPIGS